MKKISLTILLYLSLASLSLAYDLNGSMTSEGGGAYSVNVENNNGHEYEGEAHDQGNGIFDVTVEDGN